ncbi:T9SS type A sorting domain-containing protein [Neolewinella aurantiaca]|uniref:T9SS type A sorting domain-containing protein n=1 Tax=Neolewinella aurantiaca TaxID=2602767 RepID=A0A5C7FI36_9BACT|nr:T9SS type A sorting domain-containing protein [Neolewinella aurantiaca]TXF90805.1 T9SS type A sorting domain-containing protein [Neolewinella aurantiaca]
MTFFRKYHLRRQLALTLVQCLFLGLSSACLQAQFAGGPGDGFHKAVVIQLTFDGIPAGVAALYVGGTGDGFDHSSETFTLFGDDISGLFSGGRGDGFDHSSANVTLSGQALLVLFGGGGGDGFDQSVTSVTLAGDNTNQLYGGSDGDGFDLSMAQVTLNGESLAAIFGGGSGDGFDFSATNQALDGQTLTGLFGGGPGDGFDARKVSVVVNGETLARLFGGGQGDGFDVAFYAGAIPLPLDLISFDAFPEQDYVLLKWATENEQATDFFTIEKTANGLDFATVGTTDAAGYTEPGERLLYEMKDDEPYQGRSFYRLQTTDFDGFVSLSHLVEVQYAETEGEHWDFTLFPNPNTGRHFSVRTDGMAAGEKVTVEVFDVNGRALFTDNYVQATGEAFRFDLASRLASGSYLIRVVHPTLGSQAKILLVGK